MFGSPSYRPQYRDGEYSGIGIGSHGSFQDSIVGSWESRTHPILLLRLTESYCTSLQERPKQSHQQPFGKYGRLCSLNEGNSPWVQIFPTTNATEPFLGFF